LENELRPLFAPKRNMPRNWFDKVPHTHVALDDAKGQGVLFCNMLSERGEWAK
jgi:hypothetical protein